MKTAAMLAKAVAQNAAALPADKALYMATMGGAKALGLSNDIGSIDVGKWADLQAVDLSQVEQQDRKSTRLNSSHVRISYAVFCLKKKKRHREKCRGGSASIELVVRAGSLLAVKSPWALRCWRARARPAVACGVEGRTRRCVRWRR